MISSIISDHMIYGELFYTFVAFLSAFTTIICFINVGKKLSFQMGGKKLEIFYRILSCCVFVFFSFYSMSIARSIMGISGGFLVILNLLAIIKLRKEIKFN